MACDVPLQDEDVYRWLKDHPHFFNDKPELLPAAISASGKVLSLEAGHLKHLQQQNQKLKNRLEGILERVRRNDEIHQSYHQIQIRFLTADTPRKLLDYATEFTEQRFSIGRITLGLRNQEQEITDLFHGSVEPLPEDRLFILDDHTLYSTLGRPPQPVIRVGLEGNNRHLFFGRHTDQVRSEALVPLFSHPDADNAKTRLIGSLNIGDGSPSRFLPSDSTELLQDLADVLGLCLDRLAKAKN